MGKYTTPQGYFNATEMIPVGEDGMKTHKPAHFLDNLKVKTQLERIGKPAKVYRGRGACTFLPNEIKYLFIAWLALNTTEDIK